MINGDKGSHLIAERLGQVLVSPALAWWWLRGTGVRLCF